MKRLCTFLIASTRYALPVESVQEILRAPVLTPVPLAPPFVKGIFNLRGHILTSVDLARVVGAVSEARTTGGPQVVVRHGVETVGLAVDKVGDVETVDENRAATPPANLAPAARAVVREAHALPNALLLELDIEKILELA
ncbi:MAG TPA: chemotaxis protein CheW [Elusimicrobiota bacterium]|nr:chemotaxis protein CheW [Elusimicrobiota bacterium]